MPGESSPYQGHYNLWGGFSVDPKPSNSENPDNIEAFSWFFDHIHQNIANGDDYIAAYVIGWMADLVQYPRKRLGVSLVLRSDAQGTGKGLFAKIFGHLFGNHYLHITNTRHMTGHFNAHLINCVLLFADEAFWAGDKQSEGTLKTLITDEFRVIEIKGKDAFQVRNFTRLLIASNKSWVVPTELLDRRFVILDVNPRRARDTKYFGAMIKQMESGGYEALLWYLMNLKIDIDLRNCMPDTDAMKDSKVYSMTPVQTFWHECLVEGEFETGNSWEGPHSKRTLYESFKERSKKNEHTSREVFMKELKRIVDYKETRILRERSLIFSPLEECRDDFEERFGIKITEPV
jgi:phage/plasmid-associated DNA primase